MKKVRAFPKTAAIGSMAILVAVLGGCEEDGASSQEQSSAVSTNDTQAQTQSQSEGAVAVASSANVTVRLTAERDGDSTSMHPGDRLEIALRGNPTTGYEWDIASFDRSILAEGNHEYVPDTSSSNPLVGAGGTFIFRFTAVASGRTPLTLIYHRSWETVPPLDTFAADVVVQ